MIARENTSARRARILDHAVDLIGEQGYRGFTIAGLAKRCGLSNPGLLHYYGSKQAVLLAVLAELEHREAEVMAPLVQVAHNELHGADGRAAVLHILRTIVARASAERRHGRLMAELQSESIDPAHPAHDWWQVRERTLLGFFGQLLEPYVDDAPRVARQLLAMMDGLGAQWLRAPATWDYGVEWDAALARLLPELHRDTRPSGSIG